jgi:hypothetical protein
MGPSLGGLVPTSWSTILRRGRNESILPVSMDRSTGKSAGNRGVYMCFLCMYIYIYVYVYIYICVVSSAITGVSCKLPHHPFLDCKSPGWWFQPIRNMLDVHWMLHLSKGGQATTMRLKPSCNQTWQSWKIMENPSFSSMISSSKIPINPSFINDFFQ